MKGAAQIVYSITQTVFITSALLSCIILILYHTVITNCLKVEQYAFYKDQYDKTLERKH